MLKPTARAGHELACGSCGAPLHEMKWLKSPQAASAKHYDAPVKKKWSSETKRKKKSKSPFRRILEEVWDEIEDIFD